MVFTILNTIEAIGNHSWNSFPFDIFSGNYQGSTLVFSHSFDPATQIDLGTGAWGSHTAPVMSETLGTYTTISPGNYQYPNTFTFMEATFNVLKNTFGSYGYGTLPPYLGPIWYSAMRLRTILWSAGKVDSIIREVEFKSFDPNLIVTITAQEGRAGADLGTHGATLFQYKIKVSKLTNTSNNPNTSIDGESGTLVWKWKESQWF